MLVTGASGLVGRHLAALLAAGGARVTGTTRGHPPAAAGPIRLRHLDLTSPAAVDAALRGQRPEVIFHLAGVSRPATAAHDPRAAFEANVRATWVLLDAVRRVRPDAAVVYASTSPAGRSRRAEPYFASKACAELVCRSYARSAGLSVTVVRCGHVYGPGDEEGRLVTAAVTAALAGRPFRARHPARRFDLLFVDDAAAGLAAATGPAAAGLRELELTSGRSVAAADVGRLAERIVAQGPDALAEPAGRTRPPGRPCPERWRPRTSLVAGLARTVAWHRDERREEPRG